MYNARTAEIIDIVDDENKVIGKASAEEVYKERLNHRTVHVLVFNDIGELFLIKGSAQHAYCPGYWFSSASGNVRHNETYEQAARRLLREWTGIETRIIPVYQGHYDHYKMRKFIKTFRAQADGKIPINPNLAIAGRWFSVPVVLEMIAKNEEVHPELAHIMEAIYSRATAEQAESSDIQY
ncbi:NUDIX domain-containing protein [Candidatus Woesearchaeota archaeon]|nr:MAG: NUDIX domain-containing protein [Candidatus Woesearchaeota archaeon]